MLKCLLFLVTVSTQGRGITVQMILFMCISQVMLLLNCSKPSVLSGTFTGLCMGFSIDCIKCCMGPFAVLHDVVNQWLLNEKLR
jgi:hypothetical protein